MAVEAPLANEPSVTAAARRFAVIVGVNDYQGTGLSDLNFCATDAEAFYDALVAYSGYSAECIYLFSDGTHSNASKPSYVDILSAVKDICTRANDDDSILFFFAGHGTRNETDNYLLTKEYRANIIADSSICMKKIDEYFLDSSAKFKLRIFDACHSGRMGVRGFPNPDVASLLQVTAEGWATLAACKEDQFAHEDPDLGHGIFTYYIVKGLAGEAADKDGLVTLESLKVFVLDRTIELTRKLGLEQTPVFSGEQAGSLLIARYEKDGQGSIPANLIAILQSNDKELEPAANNVVRFVEQLNAQLTRDRSTEQYIAISQDEKLKAVDVLTNAIFEQLSREAESINRQLKDGYSFEIQKAEIKSAPFNYKLATYLEDLVVRESMEFDLTYRSEQRRRKPTRYGLAAAISNDLYEEVYHVDVLSGISQPSGYPESTVILKMTSKSRTVPFCAMVLSVMPSTFGAYLLCFFGSTKIGKRVTEIWDNDSFTMKEMIGIPFTENANQEILTRVADLFAQYVSFVVETIDAREFWLKVHGASPTATLTQPA